MNISIKHANITAKHKHAFINHYFLYLIIGLSTQCVYVSDMASKKVSPSILLLLQHIYSWPVFSDVVTISSSLSSSKRFLQRAQLILVVVILFLVFLVLQNLSISHRQRSLQRAHFFLVVMILFLVFLVLQNSSISHQQRSVQR